MPNTILSGYLSFDIPPFTKQYEDIAITIAAWSRADRVEIRDAEGNVTERLEFLYSLPDDAARIFLTSDICGMSVEATVDGPRTWVDTKREVALVHHDLDAWIGATRQFATQSTDLVLRTLECAAAGSQPGTASVQNT